jgi:hypothetical protein
MNSRIWNCNTYHVCDSGKIFSISRVPALILKSSVSFFHMHCEDSLPKTACARLASLGIPSDARPHPVRAIVKGRPVFCTQLMLWLDDVSRNRSKQYNAHMNMYFTSANIPYRI